MPGTEKEVCLDSIRLSAVERAFEANREAVGPHPRVSIDHFQSDCFERDFKAKLVSGLWVMTDVRAS